MNRLLMSKLKYWKNSDRRKPLVLQGARQVGKTYLLKLFGKNCYENVIYLNFEKTPKVSSLFDNDLHPKKIIKNLELFMGDNILPHKTLLIFDEVQVSEGALKSLKYFNEEANEYHIVTAGSLLGVKLRNSRSFPVGKVNFLTLNPMSFFEFLEATGKGKLWQSILLSGQEKITIPLALHQELSELLKIYFIVGGMPEALGDYRTHENFDRVREIQNEILTSYENDFYKYSNSPSEALKVSSAWKAIPNSLSRESKKFTYALIEKTARGRDYAVALEWLSDARLIHRSFAIEKPDHPLGAYKNESKFKCFFLDVGLLGAQVELKPKVVLENDKIFTEFKGALTENFVAQELIVSGQKNLFYWESERQAEIDFLVSINDHSIPIEVKSGMTKGIQSLRAYDAKFHATQLCRLSPQNISFDGKFLNIPLYGTSLIKNFLK